MHSDHRANRLVFNLVPNREHSGYRLCVFLRRSGCGTNLQEVTAPQSPSNYWAWPSFLAQFSQPPGHWLPSLCTCSLNHVLVLFYVCCGYSAGVVCVTVQRCRSEVDLVPSSHHMDSRDQTQVVRLCSKHLQPLSPLASPVLSLEWSPSA